MCLVAAQLSQSEKTKTGGGGDKHRGEGGRPDCQIARLPLSVSCMNVMRALWQSAAVIHMRPQWADGTGNYQDALACIVAVVFVLYA